MAIIKGGTTGTELDVHTVSKAARVILYNASGNLVFPTNTGIYQLPIEIIPSTLTDDTCYWAMRNLGSLSLYVTDIILNLGFSGTAAASRSLFELLRFRTATPTAGTALTVQKLDTSYPSSSVTDARFAPGGLTMTSVTFDAPLHIFGVPNQLNANIEHQINFRQDEPLVIAPNDGLAIRAYGATVANSFAIGSIRWEER